VGKVRNCVSAIKPEKFRGNSREKIAEDKDLSVFCPRYQSIYGQYFTPYEGGLVGLTSVKEKSKGFGRDVEKMLLWSS